MGQMGGYCDTPGAWHAHQQGYCRGGSDEEVLQWGIGGEEMRYPRCVACTPTGVLQGGSVS